MPSHEGDQPLVPIQPVPFTWSNRELRLGAEPAVQVQVSTPTGIFALLITAEDADTIGKDMRAQARAAKLGLSLPTDGLVLP